MLWGRAPRPCARPYLCGARCPERLNELLEALQHGAGAERAQPGQHDEGQHLETERRERGRSSAVPISPWGLQRGSSQLSAWGGSPQGTGLCPQRGSSFPAERWWQ